MTKVMQNSVANLLSYFPVESGKVAKYDIFHNDMGTTKLLVFDTQTSLPLHLAPADATVMVVDGEIDFTIDNLKMRLHHGDLITMRKSTPHSVSVIQPARVLLTLFGKSD